jgi:4-hydroxy-2-oxoheptanedioate aldolase
VVAGIHNGAPQAALARIAKGFQFVTVGSDARLMAAAAKAAVGAMRAGEAPRPTRGVR